MRPKVSIFSWFYGVSPGDVFLRKHYPGRLTLSCHKVSGANLTNLFGSTNEQVGLREAARDDARDGTEECSS